MSQLYPPLAIFGTREGRGEGREREGREMNILSLPLFIRTLISSGAHPYDLITTQSPHLHTPHTITLGV